jgi:UTP--glucose-1-phosphate uridylyltransferase
MSAVRAAVVPAAGLGTRLLPATLAVSKELLPLGRWPAICGALLEAAHAGLERVVVVVSPEKEDLRRLLDPSRWHRAKTGASVERLRALLARMEVEVVEQPRPVGVLDALERGTARAGEPCAVLFPDLIQLPDQRGLRSLLAAHAASGESVYGVREASRAAAARHGPSARVVLAQESPLRITQVAAPADSVAPGEWRTTFAAIHTRSLRDALDAGARGADGTLDDARLVRVLDELARAGRLYGASVDGEVMDVGLLSGYLDAARRFAAGAARFADLEARGEAY